jgi:hypothetical protein
MRRRKRMLDDLDEDIREHIERETQDNIDRGTAPEEARYAAMRKFGNVTRVKEDVRDVWSFVWLEQLVSVVFGKWRTLKNLGPSSVEKPRVESNALLLASERFWAKHPPARQTNNFS